MSPQLLSSLETRPVLQKGIFGGIVTAHPLKILIPSYVETFKFSGLAKGRRAFVYILGSEAQAQVPGLINKLAPAWQKNLLKKQTKEVTHFVGKQGPVWILARKTRKGPTSHQGLLEESTYAWYREQCGSLVSQWKAYQAEAVQIEMHSLADDEERGALVGMDLAAYSFQKALDESMLKDFPRVTLLRKVLKAPRKKSAVQAPALSSLKESVKQAAIEARSVNWARHLVNTPPNFLNPKTYSDFLLKHASSLGLKVEVWNQARLEKEGMGLHLAVGRGGENPPCLVKLSYRPKGSSAHPIAFVGKGITFDSGGYDMKPSNYMRLMKKDMGGSAAAVATAFWAAESKYPHALDFYLPLAENMVDAKSFRPSDVLTARNGMKIEIHDTDAEGRLVLADALDVAVTQKGKDEPRAVIVLATLTGAIRAGLGPEIAGLFANHDEMAEKLQSASQQAGDLNWRMPLFSRYASTFNSAFADIVNCTDGTGGAITAALFLERFVRQKPWAHMDFYAWTDKATGSLGFAGGSGQPVQCLIQYLKSIS